MDDIKYHLGMMGACIQRSSGVWMYTSSHKTKFMQARVSGLLVTLNHTVSAYPQAEWLPRSWALLNDVGFRSMLLAFRMPIIKNDEQRRQTAATTTLSLRETFRASYFGYLSTLHAAHTEATLTQAAIQMATAPALAIMSAAPAQVKKESDIVQNTNLEDDLVDNTQVVETDEEKDINVTT